jgi:hypothetical protein
VTGILADWNIIIVSVDSDNLVKSRSLFETLSTLHYIIISALCVSVCWEIYMFYKKVQESKKRSLSKANSPAVTPAAEKDYSDFTKAVKESHPA